MKNRAKLLLLSIPLVAIVGVSSVFALNKTEETPAPQKSVVVETVAPAPVEVKAEEPAPVVTAPVVEEPKPVPVIPKEDALANKAKLYEAIKAKVIANAWGVGMAEHQQRCIDRIVTSTVGYSVYANVLKQPTVNKYLNGYLDTDGVTIKLVFNPQDINARVWDCSERLIKNGAMIQ